MDKGNATGEAKEEGKKKRKSKGVTPSRSFPQANDKSGADKGKKRLSSLKRKSKSLHTLKLEGREEADETKNVKEDPDVKGEGDPQVSGRKDSEFNELVPFVICYEIVEELWEEIENLCHERFVHINADATIASELRDTWLSIIGQSYMDQDPICSKNPDLPFVNVDDGPPLPLNFDFWSHGALEMLPNQKRESIMDPFLRDPLSFLAAYRDPEEEEDEEYNEDYEGDGDSVRNLARPSTPVPTESSEKDETWSTASTTGSAREEMSDVSSEVKLESWHSSLNAVASDRASTFSDGLSEESNASRFKKRSLELIYRSARFSKLEIKGSTEIAYNVGGDKDREKVAFRFPNKTSSESVKILMNEQRLKQSRSDTAARGSGSKSKTGEEKKSDTQKTESASKPKKVLSKQKCK